MTDITRRPIVPLPHEPGPTTMLRAIGDTEIETIIDLLVKLKDSTQSRSEHEKIGSIIEALARRR